MKPVYSGKVREIYDVSPHNLVIVTTDRISAFDNILPITIKNKGVILNTLSNFWFDFTSGIINNHIVEDKTENMPEFFHDGYFQNRTVMVKKLKMLPFEFVVRGYIFGSMWTAYQNNENFCGYKFTKKYRLAQKFEHPIMTPAVKRDNDHDVYVDLSYVNSQLGSSLTENIKSVCFELYDMCSKYAYSKGLIIADAKFEFGMDEQGRLVLADEIFTPDSSRFWSVEDYEVGISPRSYDKQLLRDWLTNNQVNGKMQFDKIAPSVIIQTELIYKECLNRITGKSLL